MTYLTGIDEQFSLFEFDPDTGEATRRVQTSGAPATSIACPIDARFEAFRLIERKPYTMIGNLR